MRRPIGVGAAAMLDVGVERVADRDRQRVDRAGRLAELPGPQREVERAAKQPDADQRKENDEERQRRTAHHQPEHGDRQRDGDRVPGDGEDHIHGCDGNCARRWLRSDHCRTP